MLTIVPHHRFISFSSMKSQLATWLILAALAFFCLAEDAPDSEE